MQVLNKPKRILVHVLENNMGDHFTRYPIDDTGCVLIKPTGGEGAGDIKETPRPDSDDYRTIKRWYGRKTYLVYPRGANKFLKRKSSEAPPIDVGQVKKLIKVEAMRAYTGKESTSAITYILLALMIFLVLMQMGVLKA